MMGKDVERILSGINAVKDMAMSRVSVLAGVSSYRLESEATHGGTSTGKCTPKEKERLATASTYIDPIRRAMESIADDCSKMNTLGENLYTSANTFNNGYGSPWTELNKLNEAISNAEKYASGHSDLQWSNEKSAFLSLLSVIVSAAVDAKWALTIYHDYIQRGYDNKFNDNIPSIKFTSGIEKESIGNIKQDFKENVNIKKKSIDPF